MNTTSILIKTDLKVKKEAQKTAKELGLSLSAVVTRLLKEFVKQKTITFSAKDLPEIPNARTLSLLKKSEEDVKAGRVISFTSGTEALKYLTDEIERDQAIGH
ncbi:MAG TPA: type II toxin-antitoxin system RelB/DinJ family antitoxin [Candidatus Saccharimonadales bacterium]|nr:type II toxin-antitoxin system RelB/DinJ family antitoxin [Candidatus Saccharimonadales bacterium]